MEIYKVLQYFEILYYDIEKAVLKNSSRHSVKKRTNFVLVPFVYSTLEILKYPIIMYYD